MEANGTYPNRILWYIKDRGRKVSQVTEYLQISEATFAHYAYGRISVTHDYREKLAQFLRCTVDELFPLRTHPLHQAQSETPYTQSHASGAIQEVDSVQGGLHMNNGRRHALQQLVVAGIPAPLWERLTKALDKPSTIDQTTLTMLEAQVKHCLRLLPAVIGVVSYSLLQYVEERLEATTSLLEGSLLPYQRIRLSNMAGTLAHIIGAMYIDLHMYEQAKFYQEAAIAAAKEANNSALQAVSLGIMSFSSVHVGQPDKAKQALPLLHEARRLASQSDMAVLCSWLAAKEAQVQANLSHDYESRKALERATVVRTDVGFVGGKEVQYEDLYETTYDQILAKSYEGASYLRLARLQDAETVLTEAVTLCSPTRMYELPFILGNLAIACYQQGDLEKACGHASQALLITQQTLSPVHLERVLSFRAEIDKWGAEQAVRDIDRHISLVQSKIRGSDLLYTVVDQRIKAE